MKTEIKIVEDLFGKKVESFTKSDMIKAMRIFANQFRFILTTDGERVECDDTDYDLLRRKQIFWDKQRKQLLALWFSKKRKRTVAPVAKLMTDCEGKTIITYKDGNPLNLKRENIDLINRKKAHGKMTKAKEINGEKPTSIYKGVSWSTFAKKWSAYICYDANKKHLGYFINEEDAAEAYNVSAKERWGEEYSNLNVLAVRAVTPNKQCKK